MTGMLAGSGARHPGRGLGVETVDRVKTPTAPTPNNTKLTDNSGVDEDMVVVEVN